MDQLNIRSLPNIFVRMEPWILWLNFNGFSSNATETTSVPEKKTVRMSDFRKCEKHAYAYQAV